MCKEGFIRVSCFGSQPVPTIRCQAASSIWKAFIWVRELRVRRQSKGQQSFDGGSGTGTADNSSNLRVA